ncbi:MAG: alkaline phosphatase D family protein, partial [Candidatus Krumholzibacteria bacterium]|nr:alkaline phosphatase D family protein [Candidatus Krumholzibacteria bacterium]
MKGIDGTNAKYFWCGIVRREPINKETITVAGFTGNHNARRFGVDHGWFDWTPEGVWFPHNDLVGHVKTHEPDLLFFSGDQVYESSSPTTVEKKPEEKAKLDYLYKWYLWCWAFGDLCRDIPVVTIPDDHDVFQGNIWGAGGRSTDHQDNGGYVMPPSFVKMVERTQTSHLPDPYDPTPIEQGIGVYYCSMNYGGVSFAIIEDRKFKEPEVIKKPNGKKIKVKNSKLLGDRQLKFLRDWAADWSDGVWMKSLLSQTIFALVGTASTTPRPKYGGYLPLPPDVYPPDKFRKDVDSNAFPPAGRDKALREMRRGFAFHLAGDTHLGSITHYGVDDFNDAGYALCVPSIANFYPRRWYPPTPGANRKPGAPKYSGEFTDLYGNKMTVHAASNPVFSGRKPIDLYNRAPG